MHQQPNTPHSGNIDLILLLASIWKQRISVGLIVITMTGIGAIYAFYSAPIYRVSAQLNTPPTAEINNLKATNISQPTLLTYNPTTSFLQHQQLLSLIDEAKKRKDDDDDDDDDEINADKVFTLFLNTLSSHSHITQVASKNKELFELALAIPVDEDLLSKIKNHREIEFPNTAKKTNDLAPDNYTITVEGTNREALKELLQKDLNTAATFTTKKVTQFFINELNLEIKKHQTNQKNKISSLKDRIAARKIYLLASRQDNIKKLKEAHDLAVNLNIIEPSKLSNDSKGTYLEGATLLKAQISSKEKLKDNFFIDDDLRSMEAQLTLIKSDTSIERLLEEKEKLSKNSKPISLYNHIFEAPQKAVAPQKLLVISVSVILGLIIGIFIAIIRIIVKNTTQT